MYTEETLLDWQEILTKRTSIQTEETRLGMMNKPSMAEETIVSNKQELQKYSYPSINLEDSEYVEPFPFHDGLRRGTYLEYELLN